MSQEGIRQASKEAKALLPAEEGAGPLLQRDYWALIQNCTESPAQVMQLAAERFSEFAPEALCRFKPAQGCEGPLRLGHELDIDITGAGRCQVRVTHLNAQSFTFSTLAGHPEAGRITFGAYRNAEGDVIFHIRSRARSGSHAKYMAFLLAGEPMQTQTWTDFVNAVANTVGSGVVGAIQAQTQKVEDAAEGELPSLPTFIAQGD